MEQDKIVGGLAIEKWRAAFSELVRCAVDKDYFSDILEFDLYLDQLHSDEDYDKAWDAMREAFAEVFGEEW